MESKKTTSAAKLAKMIGVDQRSLNRWTLEGMPKVARGEYEIEACLLWIALHYKELFQRTKADDNLAGELRKRKLKAEAATAEEKLSQLKGEQVPMEDLEEALIQVAVTIKQKLKSLPKIARKLHGRNISEIGETLKAKSREILETLSGIKIKLGRDNPSD